MSEVAIQAPKGGAVSPLNNEFYKGGQFMCAQVGMPKGYRSKVKTMVDINRNIATITVTECRVMIQFAGDARGQCAFSGTKDQCEYFAKMVIELKSERLIREGFVPHPTRLLLQ